MKRERKGLGYAVQDLTAEELNTGTNMTMNYFGATKQSLPYHEGTMVVEGIDEATGQPNTVEVDKQDYWMAYNDVTEAGVYLFTENVWLFGGER